LGDLTEGARGVEVADHDGERFSVTVLALAEAENGGFIGGVDGEVEAADAFDGEDLAAARRAMVSATGSKSCPSGAKASCFCAFNVRAEARTLHGGVVALHNFEVLAGEIFALSTHSAEERRMDGAPIAFKTEISPFPSTRPRRRRGRAAGRSPSRRWAARGSGVGRVVVLGLAGRTHFEARHGGLGTVVGDAAGDGVARAAVGAVEEG